MPKSTFGKLEKISAGVRSWQAEQAIPLSLNHSASTKQSQTSEVQVLKLFPSVQQ